MYIKRYRVSVGTPFMSTEIGTVVVREAQDKRLSECEYALLLALKQGQGNMKDKVMVSDLIKSNDERIADMEVHITDCNPTYTFPKTMSLKDIADRGYVKEYLDAGLNRLGTFVAKGETLSQRLDVATRPVRVDVILQDEFGNYTKTECKGVIEVPTDIAYPDLPQKCAELVIQGERFDYDGILQVYSITDNKWIAEESLSRLGLVYHNPYESK